MKKYKIYWFAIMTLLYCSCTKNAKEQLIETTEQVTDQVKAASKSTLETITDYKNSISQKIKNPTAVTSESNETPKDSLTEKDLTKEKFLGITYFRDFLSECKIGETITQEKLIENHNIPADGIRLIKSITKTAEDEIEIKWKSTWLVERISDAKFTDAKMKIRFEANKIYTSGKAIGIRYNRKTYTDLIIIGNSAYIPTVKGFHWKIGK